MKIIKNASAGTLESSDAYVEISPCEGQNSITVDSVVMAQFGDAIMQTAEKMLTQLGVSGAKLNINDRGALDCVLRARIETAICRASEVE